MIVCLQGQPCWWWLKNNSELLLLGLKATFYARCGRILGIVLRRSMAFERCVHTYKFEGVQSSFIQGGMAIWLHICLQKRALKLDVLSISLLVTPYLPDWDYSIRVSFASIMKWQELFFKRKTGASTSLVVIPSFLFFKTNTKMMLIVNKKTSI